MLKGVDDRVSARIPGCRVHLSVSSGFAPMQEQALQQGCAAIPRFFFCDRLEGLFCAES